MKDFELSLPYPKDALEPVISKDTLTFHFEKHHKGYLAKLQAAVKGTAQESAGLLELIQNAPNQQVFNLAAQVWNHSFYWQSLSPKDVAPPEALNKALQKPFGSFDKFKEQFISAAAAQFGSGWAWLVYSPVKGLLIRTTGNADNPLVNGETPLLTVDVWEHAYYLDYQHDRKRYLEDVVNKRINWDFVASNLEKCELKSSAVA